MFYRKLEKIFNNNNNSLLQNMNRDIQYRQVSRIKLFGDYDVNTSTNSQYIIHPSSINGIKIYNGGANYNVSPYTQIQITGGVGSGAVSYTISSGVISSFTLTNAGIAYTGPPNILFTSSLHSTSNLVGGTGYVQQIHK